jgi:integrase
MAAFQKLANGKVQARIRKKGHSLSEVFINKEAAKAWAKKEEARLEKSEAGIFKHEKLNLGDVILRWCDAKKLQLKGFKQSQYHLSTIPKNIVEARVHTMTNEIFNAYVKNEMNAGRQVATIHRRLDQLRAILNWGIKTIPSLYGLHNVITQVEKPKLPKSHYRDRLATAKEIDEIALMSKSKIFPNFIRLAVGTGARVSELAGLQWQHVQIDKNIATVFDTKNGEDRNLLLRREEIAILKEMKAKAINGFVFPSPYQKGEAINGNSITRIKRKARDAMREGKAAPTWLNLTVHDLRHTAATRMSKTLDVFGLKEALGHKDLKSTARYVKKDSTELARALDKAKR